MKNILKSCLLLLFISTLQAKAQVPLLNSYPSASPVIFLDFDGHTVENTSWNFYGPIVCAPSGLNNTQITAVFNRVAEDYRPFNLNITTDSTKYLAAPIAQRMRVIITVTYEWFGAAGGVAVLGSFTDGDDTPCFVFSGQLGYNLKYISEAASHEAGHTLGLYHQSTYDANCVKISDYNYGVGTGEIGWAPIMGVGYYRNFTLWNNGPNPYGCTSIQNDLAVVTTSNGFGFRTDDHNNNFGGATTATFINNQFNVSGVVTQSTDLDMFKFTQPANGRLVLNAIPYNVGTGNEGSNLDLQVTLYNNSHNQLSVYNPGTLLSSIADTILNAGVYFLKVEGKGNINAPNYASLGSYSLQGNFLTSTLPLRRLELQGSLLGERHRLNWIIDADEQVIEQVLQISTDGRNFQPVTYPANPDRSYIHSAATTNAVQYRLKVTFDNNHTYYSNVVTLRNIGNDIRPKLISNLVNSNLIITSPGNFDYMIYDLSGKTTFQGKLVNGMNTIPVSTVSGGMYFIRFTDESNQWTDKFVRQ
jgi:hypothetical protein